MVLVREAVAADWRALRGIRLAALLDAPDAFASTYAEQVTRGEAYWRDRIGGGGLFLAYLPGANPRANPGTNPGANPGANPETDGPPPAGMAGGYQAGPGTVELISVFVRPWARGRGVGAALIGAVAGWARARNTAVLHLWVTETNSRARLLYERCGFSLTGDCQPLPSDPSIGEIAMARSL